MPTYATTMMIGALFFWCSVSAIAEDCLSTWKQNPVSQTCKAYTSAAAPERNVPMVTELENGQCRMAVTCKNQYGAGTPNPVKDIDKAVLKDIRNCNGDLQVDPC